MDSKENTTQSIPTPTPVSFYEKHKKIYIRDVKGWWNTWRWVLVWLTQILFYGAPWIEWNGRQAVLFHLVERKFYLFGLVLWPQDVFYLALLLIISAYALFLFYRYCRPLILWIRMSADGLYGNIHVGGEPDRG